MITIEIQDDKKIYFESDMWLRDNDRVAMCPGSRYSSKTHRWTAPLSWATCKTMRGIFGDDLAIGPKLLEWSRNEFNTRIKPATDMRDSMKLFDDDDSKLAELIREISSSSDLPMYPFQESGVKFLATSQRALLCDDMGTGKTRQTIETLKTLHLSGEDVFPAIIVSPKSVVKNWEKEFNHWWPEVRVTAPEAGAVKKRKALEEIKNGSKDVYVINFESLRTLSRLAPYGSIRLKRCSTCDPSLPKTAAYAQTKCERCKRDLNLVTWKSVVVDEAHRMKDPKAKQTRACGALVPPETKFRYALSGTIIANAPDDMWSALHMIAPEEWPSRREYIERYCLTAFSAWGPADVIGLKPEMKEEFFSIIDPRMRRMPKSAVLTQLPPKTYVERFVDMPPKQSKPYKQLKDGMIARLDQGLVIAANPLVQLTRLSQFASATCEIDDEGNVVMAAPSSKIDAMVEIMADMEQKPVVVFAQSRQLIDLAAERLKKEKIDFTMVVGGQSSYDRQQAIDSFQNGYVRAILCTISAGGVGLTLTKADTLIFLQRSLSMVENNQAEDRIHRIGAEVHESVNIIDIISNGTFEEKQREVLGEKQEKLEEIMRDQELMKRLIV